MNLHLTLPEKPASMKCVKSCPCDVIRMESGKAVIAYPADCQIYHLCRMYCPVDAIEKA